MLFVNNLDLFGIIWTELDYNNYYFQSDVFSSLCGDKKGNAPVLHLCLG